MTILVHPRSRRRWLLTAAATIAVLASLLVMLVAEDAKAAPPEVSSFATGASTTSAGGHPDVFTEVKLTLDGDWKNEFVPGNYVRSIRVDLPPGLIGNPSAYEKCPFEYALSGEVMIENCPVESQIGTAHAKATITEAPGAVFLMETPPDRPALLYLAFRGGSGIPLVPLTVEARTDSDYGVSAITQEVNSEAALLEATVSIWGVPDAHQRGGVEYNILGAKTPILPPSAPGEQRPFMINPTICDGPKATVLELGFQARPDEPERITSEDPTPTGCDQVPFDPQLEIEPGVAAADSPTGLHAELEIPQPGLFNADELGTSHLKDTVVKLPAGMTITAGGADGLAVCTTQQMGLLGTEFPGYHPIRFDKSKPQCPDASKIGTAGIDSPVLGDNGPGEVDLQGDLYLAAQNANPFGSKFAIYLVVDGYGVTVKAAGRVDADPVTGQLTTTFLNNPQLPFNRLDLDFKGGPRAPLATPPLCGSYATESQITPWARPTSPVPGSSPFEITSGPGGAPCAATLAQRSLDVGFSAGSTNPLAGMHSPFSVRITRPDGNQEIDRIELTTPEGLAATLAGVPQCPEVSIALAISRTHAGDGAQERSNPSCSTASQIGTTTIGVGAGSNPYYASGKVYLAGPYKGAPLSMVFVVPAVAGPFDLGVQVVRAALSVDPRTAQITAKSDPIPRILEGIPLRVRDVRVDIDRSAFTLNPTDCSAQLVAGKVFGDSGAVTGISNRYQVDGCANLAFKPHLGLRLVGGTHRGDYQRLEATLTARPGDANIGRVAVTLPHSEFLAQEHIRTVCTRVQFAVNACPLGSVYGRATAVTPLLDEPLSGPVYLRSSDNLLPDLVAVLRGPASMPIEIELSGRTDSRRGGIRNTFDVVPDAPVSSFKLVLQGGSKSLIVNSTDICRKVHRATVRFDAQNGMVRTLRPVVVNGKCPKKLNRSKRRGR